MRTGISSAMRLLLANAVATKLTDGINGSIYQLFQNDVTPGANARVSDFVAADFGGYVSSGGNNTWGVYRDPDNGNNFVIQVDGYNERADGSTPPQTIYGWFLTDHTNTILHAWGRFDSPVVMAQDGDYVGVPAILTIPLGTGQSR